MTPSNLANVDTAVLPDGTLVEVLNSYEASFVINEIFNEKAYPLDDLVGAPDPIIIDIGANIGIFVCYAMRRCPNARVFAFEPAPRIFDLLAKNISRFGFSVIAERCGISDGPGEAEFTYYPNYSLLSGFKAVAGDDELLLRSGISTQLGTNPRLAGRVTVRHVAGLAQGKLDGAVTIRCPLQTLSHYIDLHHLPQVDLLKVDAERCELPILRGIAAAHWPLIQRVCMELHESGAEDTTTSEVHAILAGQGFQITLQPTCNEYPRTILLQAKRSA